MKKDTMHFSESPRVEIKNQSERYRINCYDDCNVRGELNLDTRSKKFLTLFEKFLVENRIQYTLTTTTVSEQHISHE